MDGKDHKNITICEMVYFSEVPLNYECSVLKVRSTWFDDTDTMWVNEVKWYSESALVHCTVSISQGTEEIV